MNGTSYSDSVGKFDSSSGTIVVTTVKCRPSSQDKILSGNKRRRCPQ